MIKRKEEAEVVPYIKQSNPEFNKEEFINYAKIQISTIHSMLKENKYEKIEINCSQSVIEKMLKEKETFRITPDIDNTRVEYADFFDYIEENNNKYIKLYMSVYFYDNVANNSESLEKHRYWNDIWIVTYKKNNSSKNENFNCHTCGAAMKKDLNNDMFRCEYCGSIKYFNQCMKDWEIVDVELPNTL